MPKRKYTTLRNRLLVGVGAAALKKEIDDHEKIFTRTTSQDEGKIS